MKDFWFITESPRIGGPGRIVAICEDDKEGQAILYFMVRRDKKGVHHYSICSGQLPIIALTYQDHQILVSA